MSITTFFLLLAFILFVIAGIIVTTRWNRLISFGLASLTIGLGALQVLGLG